MIPLLYSRIGTTTSESSKVGGGGGRGGKLYNSAILAMDERESGEGEGGEIDWSLSVSLLE